MSGAREGSLTDAITHGGVELDPPAQLRMTPEDLGPVVIGWHEADDVDIEHSTATTCDVCHDGIDARRFSLGLMVAGPGPRKWAHRSCLVHRGDLLR